MTNTAPETDGEVNQYTAFPKDKNGAFVDPHPEPNEAGQAKTPAVKILGKSKSSRTCRPIQIFYVNGIRTNADEHRRAARHLATIAGQSVLGVFNKSGGTASDFKQCLQDWTLRVGRTMDLGKTLARSLVKVQSKHKSGKAASYELQKVGETWLSHNPASVSLFRKLWGLADSITLTIIVCHSQGNLITANACWALKQLRETASMGNIHVFGLASPNPSWPPNNEGGFAFNLYRDRGDIVPYASIPAAGMKTKDTNSFLYHPLKYHGVADHLNREDFQSDLFDVLG